MTKTKDRDKALPIRPEFVRNLVNHVEKSWDLSNNGSGVTNELWSSETKAFLDATTLKSLFFSEDWVYIICDLIGAKISSQPLRVMKAIEVDGGEVHEPVPEHPLNALMEQPNEWQDYSQWMYTTSVELVLMGNAVIWHAPKTGSLITIPAENISMEFDNKGRTAAYVVSSVTQDGSGLHEFSSSQYFDPKNIIHVRRPNPSSLLWGLSPWVPGRKSVLFQRYSADYLNAFYLKQATPGLALSLDRTVNEDVALRQLQSFEMAYQGRKNARRTLILPKGVEAKTLTHSLSDQNLVELVNQNRETICALLKVPKHELGLQTGGSLGSEEYKTALRNFWEATLIPSMRFIEGAMTKFFQKELGPDMFFEFDLSGVEALKDDILKKADIAIKMLAAGLSINEVRQKIWKERPSVATGSDDPYVLVLKAAPTFPAPAQSADAGQKMLSPNRKLELTLAIENLRAQSSKQLISEENRTLKDLAEAAIKLLVGMTATALTVIDESNKSIAILSMKAIPSRRILSRRIDNALKDQFEEEWQGMMARTLKQSVDLGYDQSLQMVFNEKDRTAIEVLRARDSQDRNASLAARGLESFAHISKTHTERIMSQIAQGQDRGESITDIMRRVADALGTPGQLTGKAEAIARTETLTAVSIGQAAAALNAKEVMPGLKKAWLTAGDDRVRDSHVALDGDTVDVDEKFSNGLRHPRDTEATDPASVINCRCTLLLLPPGEN